MDWLRWYHGTYSDPKFRVIARKAGATIPEVVAVWAAVLEAASASDERGTPGTLDLEAVDAALDMPDGKAAAIYDAMVAKRLIDGSTGAVVAWEKRQPKREDPTAADRMRKHRDAKRSRNQGVTHHSDAPLRTVTHGHDRTEQRREEQNREDPPYPPCAAAPSRTPEPHPVASDRPADAGGDSPLPDLDSAGFVLPPLVFTGGKVRDPSTDAVWAEQIEVLWRQSKGGRLRRDQVIGLLAEHVDELGAPEVAARLDRYCESVSGQFATLRNFAACIGDWSADRRQKLDSDEPLTIEEAMRRSRANMRAKREAKAVEEQARKECAA